MYVSKLLHGVLEVITPAGRRYLEASFFERLYLLWTFRNFSILPIAVLNGWQRQLMEKLLVRRPRASRNGDELVDRPVIGTVERCERRSGVFGVAHQLSPNRCNQPVSVTSRRG